MNWYDQQWFLNWGKNANRDYHGLRYCDVFSYNDIENRLREDVENKKPKWLLPLETGWPV